MRLPSLLALAALPLALATDAAHWKSLASSSADGLVALDTASYDDILSGERDFGVTVVLTAMPQAYKCQPCHDFDPVYRAVTKSWSRQPKDIRDQHVFTVIDFEKGQEIYQRLRLTTAPTVYYHPPTAGARKPEKVEVKNYDLNRNGLSLGNLHSWVQTTTPVRFDIYKPMNPVPFIVAPIVLGTILFIMWQARALLLPIIQSRVVWGIGCGIIACVFTSGFMWNRIKNAPYVTASQDGKIQWVAGGFQNQFGLETQVVGGLYALISISTLVLTILIPAQSSPSKQRIGVYLWLAMVIVLFSILIRLFRVKNGGYPFTLL